MDISSSLVSAVIPTRHRPALVLRAVRSALGQTYPNLEVVVVIDGPDQATEIALRSVDDGRLRVIALTEGVGGSDARNTGVQAARGEWIAFLDDDDEWLPRKLELQLAAAMRSPARFPVVACRIVGRTSQGDCIWPQRMLTGGEAIAEYLFNRHGLGPREGQLITSMIVARRELLFAVPFASGLRRHQDTDWYLRAGRYPGLRFEMLPEVLAVVHIAERRPSIQNSHDWRWSLNWLRERRGLMSRRAYAGFIATQLAPEAIAQGDRRAFYVLLREAVLRGRLSALETLIYLGAWLMPAGLRRTLRVRLSRRPTGVSNPSLANIIAALPD